MSARLISRGTWLCGKYGNGDAETIGQAPSSSGSSIPSHISLVEPLRPAWPSCRQNLVFDCACTKSTMRFHAASCASLYRPAQPGVMRASFETSVISVNTSPAPPMARAAVVHQVPIVGHAVLRRILAHGRHHDAVREGHAAQPERLEHRRPAVSACRPRSRARGHRAATTRSTASTNAGARSAGCRR